MIRANRHINHNHEDAKFILQVLSGGLAMLAIGYLLTIVAFIL